MPTNGKRSAKNLRGRQRHGRRAELRGPSSSRSSKRSAAQPSKRACGARSTKQTKSQRIKPKTVAAQRPPTASTANPEVQKDTPAARRRAYARAAAGVPKVRIGAKITGDAAAPRLRISNFIQGFAPEHPMAPYARKLQLPKLPNGRRPGSAMAMDDAGGGGPFPYQNFLGPNTFNLFFPGYPYLAMLAQRSEYRQPTETHAKDMTREWIEFTTKGKSDKSKKIEQIETRFEELNIQGLFREALIHDGFYGVGHIFVDLKGHRDTKLPIKLDPRSIQKGQLKGLRTIEPMWVTPVMWNSAEVEKDSFYVPETWWALDIEVHKSRLLQVISREVPDILKPAYNFGGISMSQLIEPYVDRWLKTVGGVNRLINNFSLIVLKTQMDAVLAGDDDGADLVKRLKLARMQGDNSGAFAIDFNREALEQIAVPLSGLAELQQQAVDHMAYPTHLPLVVLTGVTPSGLNASSDGEIQVYHDWNRSEQNAVVRAPLKTVLDIVQLDMFGKIDPDIGFEFRPIKQITGQARAEIKKTEAEQDVAYIDAGVVSAQEVREKVARDRDSGYVNLDVEKMPELPPDDDEEEDGQVAQVEPGEEVGGKPAGELIREVA